MARATKPNRYQALIQAIFFDHFENGKTSFEFSRVEFQTKSTELGMDIPRNLGDVVYSVRYRTPMPQSILDTQPKGLEWIIQGAGRAQYRFRLVSKTRITPSTTLVKVAIPDATPEVIRAYALDDEQALLAIVRYNRLIDTFLGLTTYSLQNHLRTTVQSVGQIEIDELYVGIDTDGCHYVIPVQAKGGSDQIGIVQTAQDIAFVKEKFDGLKCRAVSAQFTNDGVIALFELTIQDSEVRVVREKHYTLVPSDKIDQQAIRNYPIS